MPVYDRNTVAKAASAAATRSLPPTHKQARALLRKYRPDQDRDDRGRFADEGKGGAGGGSGSKPSKPKGETFGERVGRYATHAANVATIAGLGALVIPPAAAAFGVGRAVAAGQAAGSAALRAARARFGAMSRRVPKAPTASQAKLPGTASGLTLRDRARLATMYQDYDVKVTAVRGLKGQLDAAANKLESITNRIKYSTAGPMESAYNERLYATARREFETLRTAHNRASSDLSGMRVGIEGLEQKLKGKR
jgi:hypothetical protein